MNNGKKAYKVIGFFDSIMNNGGYALIPQQYFRTDQRQADYSIIYVKTNQEPAIVASNLNQQFIRQSPFVRTMDEVAEGNLQSNMKIFAIMKGFSLVAMVSGIFGVMNNLILSFIRRKRILAMLQSVGMSKRQMVKMICLEALAGGMVGGIIGALSGIAGVSIVPHVMKAINMPIPMHLSLPLIFQASVAGGLVMLVASISPALRSSRLSAIEAIKYE